MLPVAEACPAQPPDAAQLARDKARLLEEEVENALSVDHMPYMASIEYYHYAHLRRAHFYCARGDYAEASSDYAEAAYCELYTDHGPGIFHLDITEGIDYHPARRARRVHRGLPA